MFDAPNYVRTCGKYSHHATLFSVLGHASKSSVYTMPGKPVHQAIRDAMRPHAVILCVSGELQAFPFQTVSGDNFQVT